ncbi:MAG: hypothetical protein COA78_20805 [Blastopirellula sp.]|nr:MAG: hypothetical protein COA78_20805 [Blastopirellula sp.]
MTQTSHKPDNKIASDTASVFSRSITLLLDRYFGLTVTLVLIASSGVIGYKLYHMSHALVQETALRDATAYSAAVAKFRTLYTSEVVARLKPLGVQITHDYEDHAGAIPLPATLSKRLGDELGQGESNCETRLYSNYPFPWNKNGGPRDVFEQLALQALEANPTEPFYQFENTGGESYLRYATADMMRKSCVECHNDHPDTPKDDWKEGDVRGVLSVRMPLGNAVKHANAEFRGTLTVLAITGSVVLLLFGFTVLRLRRQSNSVQQTNKKLANNARQLTTAQAKLEETHSHLEIKAEDLQRSQRAALNLMQDMRIAKDSAEAATQSKSEFLANMSHEIRTPMTAILGFADIVLGNVKDPENIEGLKTVQRNGHYLLKIINDILDLSKIESGKLNVEKIECSPVQILADVASLMRVRCSAKGIELHVEFEGEIPETIQSDPTRLRQILINLVGNAIKFTEVGQVRIVVRLTDRNTQASKLQFDIIDTGIGMNEHQVEKLFQPFVQADTSTTRKFGGTGLGLAISKRLAEKLNGSITLKSKLQEGSTFRLSVETGSLNDVNLIDYPSLELAPEQLENNASRSDPQLNCNILLAEDGPDNQRLISFILKKAGAKVTVAENGKIAHDLALQAREAANPFDVILMDMQMPVLDGYQATTQLREANYTGPIIALTAHAMNSDRQKCLNAGCDDFTTKPIDRQKLIALVAQYAEQAINDGATVT